MSRQTYTVSIRWKSRGWPREHTTTAEGDSIRRAISNALLPFFSDKGRREHRAEAHRSITVHATRVGKRADR